MVFCICHDLQKVIKQSERFILSFFKAMKFQKYLANTCVSEWRLAYVDYKNLKKFIKQNTTPSEDIFLRELQIQLYKVSRFFNSQCDTLQGRLAFIERKIDEEFTNHEQRNRNDRNIMKEIKYARFLLKEYYRYCTYLINFQKLNKIAFVKVFKKYDKIHDTNLKDMFSREFVESIVFMDNRPVDYAQRAVEQLTRIFDFLLVHYPKTIRKYIPTSKKPTAKITTMRYLRGWEKKSDEFVFFRVGCYVGISSLLIIFSIMKIVRNPQMSSDAMWAEMLYIYGGMFIVVLSFFGFSCNLYLWKLYRINYVFIFELNTNHHILTYREFMEFASISLLLWAMCLYFTFHQTLERWISFQYVPLLLIGSYLVILFLPLPVFYYTSRRWFIKTIFRVFTPGFRTVAFKDFFIADLMISLTFFWTSLYLSACLYIAGDPVYCSPKKSWITPTLISIPLIIRLIQCLRRYSDLFLDMDLVNAGKYVLSIVAVYTSSWAVMNFNVHELVYSSLAPLIIWVILATSSAIYSYIWDLRKDWSFQSNDKIFPRKMMTGAVIFNLLLRFNWILTISTFIILNQLLLSFALGCLEVLRRYIWALFRMELEHTQNMERFRAIKDIPLLQEDLQDLEDVDV